MEKLIICFIFCCSFFGVKSQSISPEIISTSGGFYSNAAGMISFTEGEPIGEMASSAGNLITQGFEQPDMTFTYVQNITNASSIIKMYPNPSTNFLIIETENKVNEVVVLDVLGRKILEQKENTSQINIQFLEQGMYQIIITSEGKNYSGKFIKE